MCIGGFYLRDEGYFDQPGDDEEAVEKDAVKVLKATVHGIRERLAVRQPDKPPLEGAAPRDGSVIEEENHQRQQRRDHEREDLEHTGLRSDSSWAEELHASIETAGSETKWQVPAPHSTQEVCGSEAELPGSIFAKTALRFQDTPAGIAARMGIHTRPGLPPAASRRGKGWRRWLAIARGRDDACDAGDAIGLARLARCGPESN